LAKLVEDLEAADLVLEDWSANFRMLCQACSRGDPDSHEGHHAHDGDDVVVIAGSGPPWRPERRLAMAARSAADLRPLQAASRWWRRRSEVLSVRQVL
jgi:hypothetical protein